METESAHGGDSLFGCIDMASELPANMSERDDLTIIL